VTWGWNPDGATPTPVVEAAIAAIQNPANHGYPRLKALASVARSPAGISAATALTSIRIAKLYPYQVLRGLTHLAIAYINPGDLVLVQPRLSCISWSLIAGGKVHSLILKPENNC